MAPGGDDQAVYQRIAEEILRRIERGTLAPGDRVPSEADLSREFGVARLTVRRALETLTGAGVLVSRAREGRFVRRAPVVQRRSSLRDLRPGEVAVTSPFARDVIREGKVPSWPDWETVRLPAGERIAERLHIPATDVVVRTTYLFRADGEPVQSSVSWEPDSLTAGTPIAEPEGEGRISGVVARFDSIGVYIDEVREVVRVRPATLVERSQLAVPGEVQVHEIERTYTAQGRPVETADIVIPGDRYELEYVIPIPR